MGGRRESAALPLDAFAQRLPRFEVAVALRRDVDLLARRRIRALARGAVPRAEGAESWDHDLASRIELDGDDALSPIGGEDRIDDLEGASLRESGLVGQPRSHLTLVHMSPPRNGW